MKILSPMATGNGAFILHKILESSIDDYQVIPYNPVRTLFPPSLYSLGRSTKPDVIHTTPDYAFFHARKPIPLVLTFHNYVLDRFMKDYSSLAQKIHYQSDLKLFTKLALDNANIVTAVSNFTANLVSHEMNPRHEIRVIYNGIDHNVFFPSKTKSNSQKIQVLFCGNLTRRKGAHWLLPIAEKLGPNIMISYTAGLRTKSKLPQHSRFNCLGSVQYEVMPNLYRNADILLFPTVREGFGLAAAEAMACGLPVVATDCSSLPELIDHGKGGFLCRLGDVDAFAKKINFLAESPVLRREMGEYNRAKVEKKFTLEQMVKKYKKIFEEAIKK